MSANNIAKLMISIAITELAGIIGSIFTAPAIGGWYMTLAKPAFNPPNWVFGPVWTVLYLLMGVALFLVWKNGWRVRSDIVGDVGNGDIGTRRSWNKWSDRFWNGDWQKANIIAVFAVQLALNVFWSIIFFGYHQTGLAFFWLLALWVSIVYVMVNFRRVSRAAAWLLLPYLLWVSFAGVLNYSLWQMNDSTQYNSWSKVTNAATGISFKYPADVGMKYINTVDWPPKVQVLGEWHSISTL
ncbi:tryptophan-rich sensory protein [Patescibacteria group bacterium]|nr:tryptophan-rich sensory protein [Patescibacteria group bacterium]MDE1946663.1 tryptophan-rich sensory protein [Patescibacteria group bacterium]MDE2010616.1 tryptophan-rich sensory protein [Patescibacteria group bacterium]MDE2232937.1 tryptophan-rich sensory protein [Patescibacteria group bacterium]